MRCRIQRSLYQHTTAFTAGHIVINIFICKCYFILQVSKNTHRYISSTMAMPTGCREVTNNANQLEILKIFCYFQTITHKMRKETIPYNNIAKRKWKPKWMYANVCLIYIYEFQSNVYHKRFRLKTQTHTHILHIHFRTCTFPQPKPKKIETIRWNWQDMKIGWYQISTLARTIDINNETCR